MKTAPKNNQIEGKPHPSLIPMDILMNHLCPAYDEGLKKYYRESWRLGFPVSVSFDAMQRHAIHFFYFGEDIDPDSTTMKHHLSGVIFNAICILNTLEQRPDLDDRPAKGKKKCLNSQSGQNRIWKALIHACRKLLKKQ